MTLVVHAVHGDSSATGAASVRRRRSHVRTSSSSDSSLAGDSLSLPSEGPFNSKSPASTDHQASPSASAALPSSILLRLPPEVVIHHLLPHLNYPTLLSLRLTHPYFYHSPLLYPARARAIGLRVAWLAELGTAAYRLVPTKSGRLNLGSDELFLSNPQVQALLRVERSHVHCHRGEAGCRIVLGVTCGGPRRRPRRSWAWMKSGSGREWWLTVLLSTMVAVVAVVMATFSIWRWHTGEI